MGSSQPEMIAKICITDTGAVGLGLEVVYEGTSLRLVLRRTLPLPGWASLVAVVRVRVRGGPGTAARLCYRQF
jgi:hypothetical protein